MIQPNELRIGSLFYPISRRTDVHLPQQIPYRVLTLHTFHLEAVQPHENPALFDKVPMFRYEDISPIPLSPEILEAAGFKKHEAFTYDYYYRVFLQTDTKGCEQQSKISIGRNGTEVFINNRWLCEVKYLHTLQNLFLSISGQELTVSPL